MAEMMRVEVAYALPDRQQLVTLALAPGSSVAQAIEQSGLLQQCADIDLAVNKVGIWNRVVKLEQKLADGDRIEIYRPLIADPKEVRKQRAEKAKREGRANPVTGGRPLGARGDSDD